jgi:hypothetical protein
MAGQEDGVQIGWSSSVLLAGSPEAAESNRRQKEEDMRSRFAILLALAVVCVTTAWAEWTPEVMITGSDTTDHAAPGLVFASDGVGYLVWHTTLRGPKGVYYNRYNPGVGWAPDHQLSPTGSQPHIALDADGTTIHVVWVDSIGRYRRCVRNEYGEDEWGPVVPIGGSWPMTAIASAPNDPNHVVVCWTQSFPGSRNKPGGQAIGFMECIGGLWGSPIWLDSSGTDKRGASGIAVGPNGDVFVASVSVAGHIWAKTRHNGTWGPTVDVTPGFPTTGRSSYADIEVNPVTGNPHMVFSWIWATQISKKVTDYTCGTYHTYRNSSGTWLTTPELISGLRHYQGYLDPHMAFVDNGGAYAAWTWGPWPATSDGVQYSYNSVEGGNWTSPAWLSPETAASYYDDSPRLAYCGASQTIHAVYGRSIVNPQRDPIQIWWRSDYLGGGGSMGRPVALSQSGIELFPNPAKAGRVTVQYSLPRAEPLRVTLLDVSGRTVRTQEVAASERGSYALDVRGLNPGVYMLKLESRSSSQTRKLAIQ